MIMTLLKRVERYIFFIIIHIILISICTNNNKYKIIIINEMENFI